MVTILIVNENTKEALNLCLLSLRKYTKTPYRVLVLDNSSTDGSLELLEQFPWVTVANMPRVTLAERHGKTLDTGVRKVKTKYFLTLDSDVEILDFNWLDDMVKKIEETDGAFVGEIAPKHKTEFSGSFSERVVPYFLLVKTEFFRKNNCTFVPQYHWGDEGLKSDVGTDVLLKTRKSNHSYGLMDQNLRSKFLHYRHLTLANMFASKEWEDEFEAYLNSSKLDASRKKELREHYSQAIKIAKKKIALVNHRIDLIKKDSKAKTDLQPVKNHKQIKDTLKELSSQLYRLGEDYFDSGNYRASISKFKEAQLYADPDLKYRIMARLASAYLKNKMPQKMERVLNTLINSKPKNITVLYSIGSVYKENNDFESAIKHYDTVIRASNEHQGELRAGAYFHLGEISLNEGELSKAIEYFALCLKINSTHQKAGYYLESIDQKSVDIG